MGPERKSLWQWLKGSLVGRAANWLRARTLGYDFFISYSRTDALDYATELQLQLKERGFICFRDNSMVPGDYLEDRIHRALKRSRALIAIGSEKGREVREKNWVRDEVKFFRNLGVSKGLLRKLDDGREWLTGILAKAPGFPADWAASGSNKLRQQRFVIPLGFDNHPKYWRQLCLDLLILDSADEDTPLGVPDTSDSLKKGDPSTEVVEQIVRSADFVRVSAYAKVISSTVVVLGLGLTVAASWYARISYNAATAAMVQTLTTDLVADDLSEDLMSTRFSDLLNEMASRKGSITSALDSRQTDFKPTADDKDDTFAKQRANAAIVLVQFGEFDLAKDYLGLDNRPEPLAQFAARCKQPGGLEREQVIEFAQYLIDECDSSRDPTFALAGYSALLGVGEHQDQDPLPDEFLGHLKKWYREHPSAAIHSASAWLLGPDVVAQLNADLAQQPGDVRLEQSDKDWFVVKLQPTADDANGGDRVDYITFVVIKDGQHLFAVADRETTVGVCDQLGEPGLYDVYDENFQKVEAENVDLDPANNVTFEVAKRICEKFSNRLHEPLRSHLPSQLEWASAWGNPEEDSQRVFQFGRDEEVLKRYAHFGSSLTRPGPVATHRPSMRGMFDMHGNVGEWTLEGEMRGGAVAQPAEFCKWIPPNYLPGTHKGFRFCLSRDD